MMKHLKPTLYSAAISAPRRGLRQPPLLDSPLPVRLSPLSGARCGVEFLVR
jgi:hypothetical protein